MLVPLFFIAVIIVGFAGVVQLIGVEIIDNENLNNESVSYISNLNANINTNYNTNELEIPTSNVTSNLTNEGIDAFALQYLESKQRAEANINTLGVISAVPDTFLLIFDLDRDSVLLFYQLFVLVIGFVLGIVAFNLLFGSGRTD